jgi:hypothetical protein
MSPSNNQIYSIIGVTIAIVVAIIFFMIKKSSPSSVSSTVASNNKAYLPVLSEGEGNKTVKVSPNFSYNPSSNILTAGTFKGDLDGSAKNIKIASEILQSPMSQRILNTGGYQTMPSMDSSIKQGPMRAQGLVGTTIPTTTDTNKRFLTMTSSSSTGPQSLAVSPNVWFDTQNNLLNVDSAGSYNIKGGGTNQLLFQKGPNNTDFINAPTGTSSNQYLKWTGSGYEFSPFPEGGSIKAAGSAANQIQFRDSNGNLSANTNLAFNPSTNLLSIGGGLTANTGAFSGAISAGTGTFSGLTVGSGTITAGTFQGNATSATTSTNLAGAGGNRIPVQTGTNITSFISPGGPNTVLRWNGSTYEFTSALAAGNAANQIQFRDSTGNLSANSNLAFNPSTNLLSIGGGLSANTGAFSGTLSAGTFQGNLAGNATSATTAQSSTTSQSANTVLITSIL